MKLVLFTSYIRLINHIVSSGIFEHLTIACFGNGVAEEIQLNSGVNRFFSSEDKEEFSKIIQAQDNSSRCLSYGCGYIFTAKDIEHFEFPILNYHTGKIPQNRGRTPLFWYIIEGRDCSHGTLHAISNEIDKGRLLDAVSVSILPDDDPRTLADKLLCRAIDEDLFVSWMLKDKSRIDSIKATLDDGIYKKAFDPNENYISIMLTSNEIITIWRCYSIWGKIMINGRFFSMLSISPENGLEKVQCSDRNIFARTY